MLNKIHRLRHEKDIQSVIRKGKSVFDPVCGIRFKKNQLEVSRFAVVISKKVDKRAVVRNRLRRQYQEIVKALLDEVTVGFDVVIFPGKPALEASFDLKTQKFKEVLKKAGLC